MMIQNSSLSNPPQDTQETASCNNDNTDAPQTQENRDTLLENDTLISVERISTICNIPEAKAIHILQECDRRIVNMWHQGQSVLTGEVAQFYEVSKQEVIAASNKYSGELQSNVSCQFSPRDVLHVGMFLDSATAIAVRATLLDYVEAWGIESKRDRVLRLLENANISKWSDSAVARIADCSRSYVNEIRENKPEEIEVVRGSNVLQMKRKKKEEGRGKDENQQEVDEPEPENNSFSPHHATSDMVQDVIRKEKTAKITRTWSQSEYEEAIALIEEKHRKELGELEQRITERIGSQFERERLREVESEKEEYRLQLELALNKIDEYQAAAAEIEQLKETNSKLSQQISDLGKELQKKQAVSSQEVITKKAEELMRSEFKKQFGDLDPSLHLQALALQQPSVESPQKKAFIKRITLAAFASVATLFPNSNIEQAAAIALDATPSEIAVKAKHLNRVGDAIQKIEGCINKIGCTKDELEWCLESCLDIKQYVWAELSPHSKERIKDILSKGETTTAATPWDEDKTWQLNGRVAKYSAEHKTLSYGADLKGIDLSTVCDEWESPQVWLLNYVSGNHKSTRIAVGENIVVGDRESPHYNETVKVISVDGDWCKCITSKKVLLSLHKTSAKSATPL